MRVLQCSAIATDLSCMLFPMSHSRGILSGFSIALRQDRYQACAPAQAPAHCSKRRSEQSKSKNKLFEPIKLQNLTDMLAKFVTDNTASTSGVSGVALIKDLQFSTSSVVETNTPRKEVKPSLQLIRLRDNRPITSHDGQTRLTVIDWLRERNSSCDDLLRLKIKEYLPPIIDVCIFGGPTRLDRHYCARRVGVEENMLRSRFGAPHRAIIFDRGTHFCNDQFAKVMQNYGTHRLSTANHPLRTRWMTEWDVSISGLETESLNDS
ncbi:reverse transcriptase domain-containing protein [Tanacetum coccineum]